VTPRFASPSLRGIALLGIVLCAASVVGPTVVRADERTEARRHFRAGMRLIESGELEAGIAELEEAYATLPHPNVLFNIARAYAELERWSDAETYFERYLEADPPDREAIEELLEQVRAQAEAARPAPPAVEVALPAVGPTGPTMVTDEELAELEASAQRLDTLAAATDSQSLRDQAAGLRALARSLADRDTAQVPAVDGAPGASSPAGGPEAVGESDAPPEVALGEERGDETYAEQVVSASRAEQSVLDAPNSLALVTAQDLRMSGLTQPAEALRRVAGVELMTASPGDVQLSIRGLNQRISNRAVVLVDGRSVYLDFLGTTFWRLIPVGLEDIERIEVVRGPASALYGADAFTGVINIITRPIGEGTTYISGGVGTQGQARVAGGTSGRAGPLGVRLSAGYEQADSFARVVGPDRVDRESFATNPDRAFGRLWFAGDAELRFDDDLVLTAGTGIAALDGSFQGLSRLRELRVEDALFAQTYLSAQLGFGLRGRVFWNRFETRHGSAAQTPNGVARGERAELRRQDVLDVELVYQGAFEVGPLENTVIVGGGYRFKEVDWDWLFDPAIDSTVRSQNHFNVFLQDTLRFEDVLTVVLSGRLDRHPLLSEPQISPRGSILLHPTERQTVRFSGGTAFRAPTFTESYIGVPNGTPVRGITAFGFGNTTLAPERIISLELGYLLQESEYFSLEANGYVNWVVDQILLSDSTAYRLFDAATNPSAGFVAEAEAFPLGELRYANEAETSLQVGGEVGLRLYPVDGLDVYANYAIHETSPQSDQPFGGRELDQRTSAHKVNFGAQYRAPFGLELSFDFSWVSAQRWVEQVLDAEAGGTAFVPFDLPAYTLLNARVGYRVPDTGLELALVGQNLVHDGHRQHPFGQPVQLRVGAWATYRFR
jgi:outer membrane receptor for ferrienterochelin and colicin